ncbi:MAG TPA: OmpA family protein [Burkholderiaceae bacterium]|nr:OmpA family protein [Burkholderiaceae bacterium]
MVASVAGVAALACSTTPTLPSHKEAGAAIAFCQRTVGGQLIWASCAPQEVAAPTPKTPVPLLAPLPRKEASASPAAVQPAGPTPQPAVPPKEPAPAMRPAAIGPSPVPPRSVFWSRSVYFAAGADRSPALNNAVEAVASRFGALPEARVVIVGMTDATGSATLNAALAHRRAEAVRQRLIAAGVPAHAITSYADTSASRPPPVAQADQPKAAGAVYRRADILIRWRPAATA